MDPMLTGIPFVDAHGALRPGQLLEVCGVGGSGKTEILMQAAVHAVTPRRRGGVAFNGCEASVLLIDLDGKFDTLRLIKILTGKIRDTVDEASARAYGGTHSADASTSSQFPGFHPGSQAATQRRDDVPPERRYAHPYGHDEGPPPRSDADRAALRDRIYVECMGRFQTIRCHCSLDFLKALAVAERVFQERERKAKEADVTSNSTPPEDSSTYGGGVKNRDTHARRLLLIDNVAAFYWLDRASRREHDAPLSLHNVHHASALALIEISRRCRAPVVATKAVAATSTTAPRDGGEATSSERARTTHKDFLPPRWTSAVTQRLVLEPEPLGTPRARRLGEDGATRDDADGGARFQGRGGVGTSFVARWELPAGRPSARYRVDGEAGIRTVG